MLKLIILFVGISYLDFKTCLRSKLKPGKASRRGGWDGRGWRGGRDVKRRCNFFFQNLVMTGKLVLSSSSSSSQ